MNAKNESSIQLASKYYWKFVTIKNSIYWKVVTTKNSIYWKVVNTRNSLNSKLIAIKNAIYWRFYNSDIGIRLSALINNFQIYFLVLLKAFVCKLQGKKLVVVFFLVKSHNEWLKEVLFNLKTKQKLSIQLFSPDNLSGLDSANRYFCTKTIVPTRGIQVLPVLWADLYITPASTTANNAPPSCPKVMFMHSLISIHGVYEDNTFDGYDYIYCTGKHHIQEFRNLFREKGLTGKCLIPGGYPRLDELIQLAQNLNPPNGNWIIIAPTLLSEATEHDSLMMQAHSLVNWFIRNGWSVLFRPHPNNLKEGNKYLPLFESLIDSFHECDRFEVDRSKDYLESYARSTLMLSDISGTAYTYAFAFGRPVVFYEKTKNAVFSQGLLYENRYRIGPTIQSVDELQAAMAQLMENYTLSVAEILKMRNEFIYNIGSSADYFSENVSYILKAETHSDWIYV